MPDCIDMAGLSINERIIGQRLVKFIDRGDRHVILEFENGSQMEFFLPGEATLGVHVLKVE